MDTWPCDCPRQTVDCFVNPGGKSSESDEAVDHRDAAAGKLVHAWQQFSGLCQGDTVADQAIRLQLTVRHHCQHAWVFEGLHAVASEKLQFLADHSGHGKRRIGSRAGHESDLDMSSAFPERQDGISAGVVTTECIDGDVNSAITERLDSSDGRVSCGIDQVCCSAAARQFQTIGANVDRHHTGSDGCADHDCGESDATAAVDGQPFTGLQATLHDNTAERGRETAAEAGGGCEIDGVREFDEVHIRMSDFDVLREGSPLRETGLGVVVADMLVAAVALRAVSAAAAERHCDAGVWFPAPHIGPGCHDDSCEFVTGDVWQVDIGVVSHPAVPVAATEPAAANGDDCGIRVGSRVSDVLNDEGRLELFKNGSLHGTRVFLKRVV